MEKAYDEFATFSKDNIDALVRTNAALTRGLEQLSKSFLDLTTRSIEEAIETSKRFSTVKSVPEAIEFQTKFAQEKFETLITETKKMQELAANILKEASTPLTERLQTTGTFGATAATRAGNTSTTKKPT